uniref:DiGeorge syndrome critical region gene 6 n=1 Tax=Rhinopithecus bieti TaxID=61621 RepID=A0A2K6M9B2_RHIBE
MERYAGALEEVADGARQQERHYQLLSALQSLVKELPSSFQQRLSYTTLSDLALALLDGTVFEIVQGLLEIQHLTEKSLYNQRLRLQNEHRGARGSGTRCLLLGVRASRQLLVSVLTKSMGAETETAPFW